MFGLAAIPSKIAGALIGFSIIGVFLYAVYQNHVSTLEENVRLTELLKSCQSRTLDILQDKESDASVGDPSTYIPPEHWLFEF